MAVFLHTHPDLHVAQLAADQHGVIATSQLHAVGITRGGIEHRVATGRLHRVHRGVYVVGVRRLTATGRLWAAVLACGGPEVAAISHLTAAAAWRMRDSWPSRIDVATLRACHSRVGLLVHRTLTLDDLTRHRGLAITTPACTLTNVTPLLDDDELLRACNEARYLGRLDLAATTELLTTGPSRLRHALERLTKTGPYRTKSELEDQLLALVDRYGLPRPLVNVQLHGYTVDFLWPEHKLVVETDGRNHLRPIVYEADRERDADLQELGYRVYRVTSKQLDERPAHVARRLGRWLA